jgi:hypothetical protein
MNTRSKLGLIAALGVIVVGVLFVLRQGPSQTEEQRVMNAVLSSSSQFTISSGDCGRILQSEPWCSVVQDVKHITRPEWETLFPQTKFFLIKRNVVGQESGFQRNMLIAEQAGQQYNADSFQNLLDANSVVITDSNRELVAKAFALMTLPDYLQDEITFSDSKTTDERGIFSFERFNYTTTAWTKVQGLKIVYLFFFQQGRLRVVTWNTNKHGTGIYIDVPSRDLSPVQQGTLRFQY